MAKMRVEYDPADVAAWMESNPQVKQIFLDAGAQVVANAQATAGDAEGGAGGRIDGYASAGFRAEWDTSKRPQVKIYSNADSKTATAAHFSSMKRFGIAHLRAALYSITLRG